MSWLTEFFKAAAVAGPASLSGGAATSITPPMNPVQQIAAQRGAVQSDASGDQTALMEAQQATAAAEQNAQAQAAQVEQQAAQQVGQLQQQLSEQSIKSQQEIAAAANKAHSESEQMKAQLNTEKAKAELAKVEAAKSTAMAELNAKGKEVETNRQVTEHQLGTQQAQAQAAPQMAGLEQRVNALGSGEPPAKPKPKADIKKKANQPAVQATPGEAASGIYHTPRQPVPAAPQNGAGWAQSMQGFTNPGGKLYSAATYRPSFGAFGDSIVGGLLPAIYGQPDWSKFFSRGQAPAAYDPRQLAIGVGQDLARSFI